MGRGRSYFISVLFLSAFLLCSSDSKELSRELTCYRDDLKVECGEHSIIAIHQAYFTSQRQENHTCHSLKENEYIEDEEHAELTNHSYCYEDVRVFINRRCSGLQNCTFSYSGETEKSCSNPEGVLIVHFDCVRVEKINKYCNAKVTASEGYIMQPAYPNYYPELSECSWSLSAAEGQTILVKILHLHISPATEVSPTVSDHDIYSMGIGQLTERVTQCDRDSLSVFEGNMKRFSVCGEDLDSLRTVEADASNDLVIKFKSASLMPASGFLAYYKIHGCPDMPAGEDSYLVERNGTAATYACRNDLVFNDTLENTRFVHCIRDHHWSSTLPPCIQVTEDASTSYSISFITAIEQQSENTTNIENLTVPTIAPGPRFTEDILIPCIIIVILLLGNGIIVIIICIMRRNKKEKDEEEEEEENLDQPKSSSSP